MGDAYIDAGSWAKGIFYSVCASIVGGASKLAIRKSWLMVQERGLTPEDSSISSSTSSSREESGESDSGPSSPYHLNGRDSSGGALEMVTHTSNHNSEQSSTTASMTESQIETTYSSDNLRQRNSKHQNTEEQFEDHNGEQVMVTMTIKEEKATKANNSLALGLRYSGMFGMTFLNPLFCVLAMNYASPSILAPFSGLTLVWIILFSEQIISERPEKKQIIAAALIIVGQIVVGVFGDHTNDDDITLEDVEASYEQISFQLFFVGMAVWLSFLAYLMVYPPTPKLRRFAWGVTSGSITGFQNFLKDSLSVIKACKANDEPLPWYFYVLASFAALTAFSGLLVLTRCMKRYDATFSSAMFVGSFIISASIMADIHYHTFSNLVGITNYIMYPSGLGVLMVGLYMLVQDTEEPEIMVDNTGIDGDQLDTSSGHPGLRKPLVSTDSNEEDDNTGMMT